MDLNHNTLEMDYNSSGLRSKGRINGASISFDDWSSSGVYTSDVLNIGSGKFKGSIDDEGFTIIIRNKNLFYE
jgi:hypothetical protein